jgi:hypothetical protein
MSDTSKPPVGLRPEWIAAHHEARNRLIEIAEAMSRYAESGVPVPIKWCWELERRITNYIPDARMTPTPTATSKGGA